MSGTKAGAAKRRQTLAAKTQPVPSATEGPAESRPDFVLERREDAPVIPVEPVLLEIEPVAPAYVVGKGRRVKVGSEYLMEGAPVPGAHLWPRLEVWLRTGILVENTDALTER